MAFRLLVSQDDLEEQEFKEEDGAVQGGPCEDCVSVHSATDSEESDDDEGDLEQDLSCAVCHEVFDTPKTLSCGHSFCLKCIKGCMNGYHAAQEPVLQNWVPYYPGQESGGPNLPPRFAVQVPPGHYWGPQYEIPDAHHNSQDQMRPMVFYAMIQQSRESCRKTLPCPMCKEKCPVPDGDPEKLKTSFALKNACVTLMKKKLVQHNEAVRSDVCLDHQKPMVLVCVSCRPLAPGCISCTVEKHGGDQHDIRQLDEAMEWCRKQVWPDLTILNGQQKSSCRALTEAQTKADEWKAQSTVRMKEERERLVLEMEEKLQELAMKLGGEEARRDEMVVKISEKMTRMEKASEIGSRCMLSNQHTAVFQDFEAFENELEKHSLCKIKKTDTDCNL